MVLESNTLDVLFVKDGQQGEDGKILYTWIKYAKDANGTGITDDPNGAIYIGISYNNESSTESNDPTQYAWTKIQGADGKKGEDAYTIFLENENISFATDKNRNPLSEQAYTSGITIMKGEKPVTDFTIGDIAKTQGIAVAKTDTAIAISVVNGNSLPNDSGEIEIPITVGGTVFKKILTWTCAKKGDQGEKGERGLQGIQGPQGIQGVAGKDGTSVTITNKSITYQLSTSGTTIPTGTWQTSPQTIPEGQYQWTKTSVTYSDGNKTESYSISYHGKNGSDGTSVKTTSTSVKYQVGDSGTTKPTGTWQSNVPTVAQGKYLWTQTIVNYSDGNSTESYSVSYRGIDGSNGVNGMNVATIYLYQRATSTPSKPSNTLTYTFSTTKITGTLNNGWSTAIPTGTDAVYVTVASVSSKNDTATIATSAWSAPVVLAQNGKTGSDGKAGLNVATIYLYQRNTSKPSKPSASVTYTFSTGVASGLNNGWSQKIPDGTNPLYVTLATASSNTATDTILSSEWSDVVVMAQNGEDGISPKVSLSKSGNTTTISIIDATGTHTQTVKDGTNGTPGAAGKDGKTSYFHVKYSNDGGKTFTSNSGEDTGIYMGSYTDYTETDSTDVKKYNWVKVKGDKGDTGQKGDNAKNLSITPSSQYFKSTDGGKTFAPNTITIRPTIQGEISFGKWQYSIDGGVSFADVVGGQKGLTISNNVLTVSKDSSLYSDAVTMITFRAVASDSSFYDTCSIAKIYDVNDIGDGRNLLWNSNFAKTDEAINTVTYTTWGLILRGSTYTATIDTSVKHNNFNTLKVIGTKAGENGGQDLIYRIKGLNLDEVKFTETDVKYTLSFYAKASIACNFSARYAYDSYAKDTNVALSTDWKRYEIQMYPTTTSYQTALIFKMDAASTVWFSEFKLEKGSSATGYSTAPEDVQTAILSTKSEISDVSLKVDKNKQAIEQRVEKTTYQQDLNLVKGDISKANEGLNKWRYEIYPKSLFASEYQGKSTMDVFAKNTNLTPSQSVLINDTDLSIAWNYDNNYIGYALTFAKFSAAKSVAITFAHDDGAHIYLNGKLIGGSDAYSKTGESLTLGFVKGWNCIEVVVNEGASTEGFKLGTTLSAISECQLMNCYYGTPVARQSHITNQLVQNTTDIKGISTKVSKVTSVIGDNGENFTSFKNDYSDFKQTMNGFKTTVGQTYVTKDDFNGLEIGGRNLARKGCIALWDTSATFNDDTFSEDGSVTFSRKSATANSGVIIDRYVTYEQGQQYVISFKMKANSGTVNSFYLWNGKGHTNNSIYVDGIKSGTLHADVSFPTDGQYHQITAYFTATGTTSTEASDIGVHQHLILQPIKGTAATYTVQLLNFKIEKGNKATDWTPAPEDDEINGQNLVSNLPSNWEQGSFLVEDDSKNKTYSEVKVSEKTQIRIKELIPVSGDIVITAQATQNSSKEALGHYVMLFDVNKRYMGKHNVNGWNTSFPRMFNCGDAKYIAIALKWGDGTKTQITPSDISQICLKIERGTSATPFTLAPEDVNGKIVNVETIANQTAKKFEWIVKGESTSSNLVLTDNALTAIANNINLTGKVTFNSFDQSLKDTINNKTNVSYLGLGSAGDTKGYWKIATISIHGCHVNQEIIIGVNHRHYGYTECRIKFQNVDNEDPDLMSFRQTGQPPRAWEIIKTATSTWDLYLWKTESWDGGRVVKYINPYDNGLISVTWSGENADLPSGTTTTEQMIADQTTIDGGIITTGYLSADRIAGGSITADKIATDAITADKIAANAITADKIATDAIKSHNYISSGGTQGSFLNLKDGSFTAPNLSWDLNGNLIAKNANLSGQITATKGSIGKYKITDQWLITGSGSTATGIGGNQAFWAGAEDSNSAPFRVGYNGQLVASGATISGDITATTGKIGDLTLKDGILTGTGSYSEPYTEDDDGTVTSTVTTNYITKLFGKGLTIDSTVKYSDEDDVYSYKVSVLPDEISFTDGEEIGMLGAGGLQILQVNDNSDSYSSEANEVSLSSGASNFYYTTPVNQTTDKYLHVCFSADGASFMASQGDKFNSFDIGYSSAKYSGNFAANKFVYTGNSLNYVECLEANDTTNVYFHSSGYYSFRVNNEGNWSNETQSVYITERGISVPGKIGLYSQEMSNYVARYYVAGSTKSTAIGNNSYQTRIYGSSVWANKAVSTSDVRLKQDFQSLDKFEDLYMQLQPVSFKYIDGYDKSEDRYFGLKAQPTEKLFEDMGENPDDYAMFNKFGIDHEDIKERIGYDVDFDEEHGLDYTNLITLNTHMVQKTRRELAELQKENAELKDMLKTIVKKINM